MAEQVRSVRRYDGSRRREQARENRGRVLAAAGRLFLEKGYAGTAMPEIAQAAGVSVQMVYKAFANKATLLKALFDVSVAGDDEEVPIADRDLIATIRAEPDAARKIAIYTAHLGAISPRTTPLQLLAQAAAGADPAAAQVWQQMRAEMLNAMSMFAAELVGTGQVRPDRSVEDVRDILWTFHGPELYDLLVVERGWSSTRYGEFLREAMTSAVLVDPRGPIRR